MPKILLVEDDEMSRDMLLRRLNRKGFDVITAADGAEGVRLAQTQCPDLIIMDMNLPILDGWQATQKLKSAPDTQSIPVVGLSAHAMAGDYERGIRAGCDDYATKPVEFPRLLEKIQALLANHVT